MNRTSRTSQNSRMHDIAGIFVFDFQDRTCFQLEHSVFFKSVWELCQLLNFLWVQACLLNNTIVCKERKTINSAIIMSVIHTHRMYLHIDPTHDRD